MTPLMMASIILGWDVLARLENSRSLLKCKPDANMTKLAYTTASGRWQSLASVGSWARLASVCGVGLTPVISALWSTLMLASGSGFLWGHGFLQLG